MRRVLADNHRHTDAIDAAVDQAAARRRDASTLDHAAGVFHLAVVAFRVELRDLEHLSPPPDLRTAHEALGDAVEIQANVYSELEQDLANHDYAALDRRWGTTARSRLHKAIDFVAFWLNEVKDYADRIGVELPLMIKAGTRA